MIRALFHGGLWHGQDRLLEKLEDRICVVRFTTADDAPAAGSAETDPDAPIVGPYRLHCDPPESFAGRRPCIPRETIIYRLHWVILGGAEEMVPVYLLSDDLSSAEQYVGWFAATLHALTDWLTTNRFWLARSLDLAHHEFQNSLVRLAIEHNLRFR